MCLQVPDKFGAIRALSEGKGEEFLVGTSRNFILRGTFNDGFQVEVQVRSHDIIQLIEEDRHRLDLVKSCLLYYCDLLFGLVAKRN